MLSDLVRAYRQRLGMTQEELAERSGLSVRSIRKIESGQTSAPRPATARLLAGAFALTGGDLDRFLSVARGDGARHVDHPLPRFGPRQLPAPPRLFTGRETEIAALDGAGDGSTVVVTAIDGMAGVGKTALAVFWAHRMAGRYPDGQLFLDLHGFSAAMPPVTPGDALDRLLQAVGVAGDHVPAALDDRAGLWRSVLAHRRMLIVLDNAAAEAQVAPLMPGTPGCLVLVTSRRRLAGLDATRTVSLEMLSPADARTLFVRAAGKERVAAEAPALVAETVELCGRLPLAIRSAAARLRSRTSWKVADLVARLRGEEQRLTELTDGSRGVVAALALSYHQLGPAEQALYRLLGLHPGSHIDAYAAAALAGATLTQARQMLDRLLDAHLLQERSTDRYALHDLVRAHAGQLCAATGTEHDRRAALTRLLDHYRHTAWQAAHCSYPYQQDGDDSAPPAATAGPDLHDPTTAVEWLDDELPNLLAAARYATHNGWPDHTCQLSTILRRHLHVRGHYRDAEALHQLALSAATAVGSRTGQLWALNGLSDVHLLRARHQQALDGAQRALALARDIGDPAGELDALITLGSVHRRQSRHEQAVDQFEGALRLARTTGKRTGELDALIGLGLIHLTEGRYEEAIAQFEGALRLARTTGNRTGELDALIGLGRTYFPQGHYKPALDHLEGALRIARTTGNRTGELKSHASIGWVHRLLGNHDGAFDHLVPALEIAQATGNRTYEHVVLHGLGWVHRSRGDHEQALGHYRRAWEIARSTGNRHGELVMLIHMGDLHRLRCHYEKATDQYRHAVDLANQLGNRNLQFEVRQGLGRLHCAAGQPDAALADHRQALALATELSQPADQARAHDGLAHAYRALRQPHQARRHWRAALEILTTINSDDTEDEATNVAAIRAHLGGLNPASKPSPPS